MSDALVVLTTVPSREQGDRIAEIVVDERLAACVNLIGAIRSVYHWEGKVCRDDEHLLVMKTTRSRYPALEARIRSEHPYQVPEIIALPVATGSEAYLEWLVNAVRV